MRLLVIGNAALDRCCRVARLPRQGESVLAAPATAEPGGKGLNQAVMAARTGAAVTLLAMLGSDDAGARLCRHLRAEGLDGTFLLEHKGPSDESIVLVGPSGDNLIVSTHAAANAPEAAALPDTAAPIVVTTLGAEGARLTTALAVAIEAASLKVGRAGTAAALPTAAELLACRP